MFGFFDNLLANSKSGLGKCAVCAAFGGIFVTATVGAGLVQQKLNAPVTWLLSLTATFLVSAAAGGFGAMFLIWLEAPSAVDSEGQSRRDSSLPRTILKTLMLGIFAAMILLMVLGALAKLVLLFLSIMHSLAA